ncbi:recombinase RecA [Candidatus Roizmanbacteria bacterium RIFCSPLOWO2_02_FULL_43_10]|uniref:Protein RecA n=2 Tax=Candidatus Roizmaniibacteriota TaxID=1752723 RepID=A0A1F7JSI3_9BACT|nr:MAG: recombinase RecA [Candidatus Roizmanbacteria bacterium RIFCSPHIGHO2_02_FULL_43_11]OGK58558.1 MAG: recombinase RecA [Candidatus Roizmanbacteria bacterium RIFCSPLOWO2_02_FULL_43_10]
MQAVQVAVEQIQKQFGIGSIMKLGDRARQKVDVIPSGIIPLDIALGIGGIPRGRIIEIFGPEASGKTTLCLDFIAQVQKEGGIAAFVDAEHALDPTWAEILGVDVSNLLVSQPDTGEQALEITEALIRSGGVDLVVVDSVAALVPRSEIEGEMGDSQIGVQARLMSQALRKLTSIVSKSQATIIFTNQIRHKIGVMFGNPETTPGGLALKFYTSIRIDVRKTESLKKGDEVIGARHRAKIVKNKMAPPFKQALFIVDKNGIDKEEAIIDAAVDIGALSKSGAFFKQDDRVLAQGKAQLSQMLKGDKKLRDELLRAINDKTGVSEPA